MDVDYANSKGSYVITQVAKEMSLATSDIITWNDYRKEDGESTFGLLSSNLPGRPVRCEHGQGPIRLRPDSGDRVLAAVFPPIKGILCIYDRETKTFAALPGADDKQYVQSNPTWSPDGRYIVFARANAYQLKQTSRDNRLLLTEDECEEFVKGGRNPFDLTCTAFPSMAARAVKPNRSKGRLTTD